MLSINKFKLDAVSIIDNFFIHYVQQIITSKMHNQEIYQLLYLSSACEGFDQIALLDMLAKAREKNSSLSITGLLLHNDGNFLQLIEGPKQNIHKLFNSIRHDKRHKDIIVLIEKSVDTRLFSEWSMGLRELSRQELTNYPGLSNYFGNNNDLNEIEEATSQVLQLIAMFRENNH